MRPCVAPRWLSQGGDGSPRIYDVFRANVQAAQLDDLVLPIRTSASVGLRYIGMLTRSTWGRVPKPSIVYVDAAHEYPETLDEIQQAWKLLAPGGFLVGDDYGNGWGEVDRSVNEFAKWLEPRDEAVRPEAYACAWPMAHRLRKSPHAGQGTYLLHYRGTWLIRKRPDPAGASSKKGRLFGMLFGGGAAGDGRAADGDATAGCIRTANHSEFRAGLRKG